MDIIFVADRSGKVCAMRLTKWMVALAVVVLLALIAMPAALLRSRQPPPAPLNGTQQRVALVGP